MIKIKADHNMRYRVREYGTLLIELEDAINNDDYDALYRMTRSIFYFFERMKFLIKND